MEGVNWISPTERTGQDRSIGSEQRGKVQKLLTVVVCAKLLCSCIVAGTGIKLRYGCQCRDLL